MTFAALPQPVSSREIHGAKFAQFEFLVVQVAVFLAPFSAFRFSDYFITASDCLFVLACALRFMNGVPFTYYKQGATIWLLGLLMLCGGLLASSLYADPMRGLIVVAQYQFAYLWLPFAILFRPREQTIALIKCGVWSMVVLCLIGFVFYFTTYNGGIDRQYVFVTGGGRMASLVDNPNGLAGLIVMALPLLGFLIFARQIGILWGMVLALISIVGLVLTSSNTGIFVAFCGTAVFLLGRKSFGSFAAIGLGGAAAYLAIMNWGEHFLPETFQKRVLTALVSGDVNQLGTFTARYDLMAEAWGMLDRHLWLGLGADQYRTVSQYRLPVHNLYLLLFNEGGLISLVGWLTILLGAVVTAIALRRRRYGELAMLTTITVIAVVLAFAMASSHLYARFLVVPLLLAVSPLLVNDPARPIRARTAANQTPGTFAVHRS